ncbi:MAG TPA: serine protease [Tepidisphaeraceae bacterium]|jgi:hypothetical protein
MKFSTLVQSIAFSAVPAIGAVLALPPRAGASITLAQPLNGSTTAEFPGAGLVGDSEGFFGSGVVVGDGSFMLTARHVVTQDGAIGGALRPTSDIFLAVDGTTYSCTKVFADFEADLALLKLNSSLTSGYSLWSAALGNEIGRKFTGVGFGLTNSDGNNTWGPGGFGTKRAFENVVDAISPGIIAGQGEVLRYDYDAIDAGAVGPLEGIAAPGDSGGGIFFQTNNHWWLAGIITSTGSPTLGSTGSVVRLASYESSIHTLLPEPAASTAVAAAFLFGVAKRRRRGTSLLLH